ncbi:replication initiation protein [Paraburkholderia sp. C35]|uniref:replication initiation protein n=1 Tax=Paraburkholderia sp. C35 TaxID=2126993 RepID=UPI001EF426FB|nr:replication initiation protein [Paraburkholderia sp. C35]
MGRVKQAEKIKIDVMPAEVRSAELAKLDERELRKHVAAIHVSGNLSLVERKIVNVLLLHAYDDLLTKREHTISVRFLCEAIGWEASNDHKKLAQAAENIMHNIVTLNMFADGKEDWKKTPLVSSIGVKDGRVTYAYIEWLAERYAHPEVFAAIDIKMQRRFKSQYALALYENCLRYRKIGQTRYAPVDTWRELLGATGKMYEQYRHFSNFVLQKAIKEVNAVSDIDVELRFKKEGRTVTELQFGVTEKAQAELPFEVDPKEAMLREQLTAIGFGESSIKSILSKNLPRAALAIKVTLEREAAGKITGSASGYFMSVFESDSPLDLPERTQKKARKAPALPSADEVKADKQAAVTRGAWGKLTDAEKEALTVEFVEKTGAETRIAGKHEFANIAEKAYWTGYRGKRAAEIIASRKA